LEEYAIGGAKQAIAAAKQVARKAARKKAAKKKVMRKA